MPDMPKIYTITIEGNTYELKDAYARQRIEDLLGGLTGAMHYGGITTTPLSDGSTTATLSIGGNNKTFAAGDAGAVVVYGEMEYVWNGSKWQEFGSTGSLKALAFKDSATGSYTPSGDVSKPTFTGSESSFSVESTPSGSVTISKGNGTANYTPEGSVSVTPDVQLNETTVNSIESVGTLPTLTMTVENENLTISFNQGSLPTKGANTTVATGIKSQTASATFTGTGADLEATFTGTKETINGKVTPEGDVSKPTFTGTPGTVTVS